MLPGAVSELPTGRVNGRFSPTLAVVVGCAAAGPLTPKASVSMRTDDNAPPAVMAPAPSAAQPCK